MAKSRAIEPLAQGDLDGLCGIYSIINAIRAIYPKRFDEYDQSLLFQCLADYAIKEQGNLGVLYDGIGLRHMQQLINVGIEYLSEDLFFDVEVVRPWRKTSSPAPTDWQIKKYLINPKTSIIVGLERPSQHWTVIRGCEDGEFIVLDSGNHENIPCNEVLFTRKPNSLFDEDYIIVASSIFVLSKVKSKLG